MSNKPIETLRDGAIKATIWENTSQKDGTIFHSVDIVRGYKDANDQWNDTTSFSGAELLRVSNLATQAYNLISEIKSFNRNDADTPKQEFQEHATGGAS